MNQHGQVPDTPLTAEQHLLVLSVKPMVEKMVRKLGKMFRDKHPEDIRQTVWLTVSMLASQHDSARGDFDAFAWKPVFGNAVETFQREGRENPLYLGRKAFLNGGINLRDPREPFVSEDELLDGLQGQCDDGVFRMFFGATFEAWRTQGEQGTVNHLSRLRIFGALRTAFATLASDDWEPLRLYYIECLGWAEVAAALGISERQSQRRCEESRMKLRRELQRHGVRGAPPEEG